MDYEVITRAVEAAFVHTKAVAGAGEFAKVVLRLEPLPAGEGLKIVNGVADNVIPARLIEGAYDGVQEAAKKGILAGRRYKHRKGHRAIRQV